MVTGTSSTIHLLDRSHVELVSAFEVSDSDVASMSAPGRREAASQPSIRTRVSVLSIQH